MQDENTLRELGFKQVASSSNHPKGDWFFYGNHQIFTAKVIKFSNPTYVILYMLSPEMDRRPLSEFCGQNYRSLIKDCCSTGSIERAILKYDVHESRINRTGLSILFH